MSTGQAAQTASRQACTASSMPGCRRQTRLETACGRLQKNRPVSLSSTYTVLGLLLLGFGLVFPGGVPDRCCSGTNIACSRSSPPAICLDDGCSAASNAARAFPTARSCSASLPSSPGDRAALKKPTGRRAAHGSPPGRTRAAQAEAAGHAPRLNAPTSRSASPVSTARSIASMLRDHLAWAKDKVPVLSVALLVVLAARPRTHAAARQARLGRLAAASPGARRAALGAAAHRRPLLRGLLALLRRRLERSAGSGSAPPRRRRTS